MLTSDQRRRLERLRDHRRDRIRTRAAGGLPAEKSAHDQAEASALDAALAELDAWREAHPLERPERAGRVTAARAALGSTPDPHPPVTWRFTIGVAAKLGSALVHANEALSPKGHEYDRYAFSNVMSDPDVQGFLRELGDLGLLPEKRR